jgi:hypothetical protein
MMAEYRIKGLANQQPQYRIKGLAQPMAQETEQEQIPEQETMGLKGVFQDLLKGGKNTLASIPGALLDLPGEAIGATRQAVNNPMRAAQNVVGGTAQLGHSILQGPGDIRDYMVRKGLWPQDTASLRLPESVLPRDYNYSEALGAEGYEPGDELLRSIPGILASGPAARIAGRAIPPVTSKGIVKKISEHKAARTAQAKKDYGNLFQQAAEEGVNYAVPLKETAQSAPFITKHTTAKYSNSLNDYLKNPTLENAHWAQSELGYLTRHLEEIEKKNGLTPSQAKLYRAAKDSRDQIRQVMFNDNAFGSRPHLGEKYNQLSEAYKQDVVPYRRLEPISEFEAKKMKASTALDQLRKDDEFMIQMASRYPGIFLRNDTFKKAMKILGGGALAGLGFKGINTYFK